MDRASLIWFNKSCSSAVNWSVCDVEQDLMNVLDKGVDEWVVAAVVVAEDAEAEVVDVDVDDDGDDDDDDVAARLADSE